jgi:hypothetical protein
MNSENEGQWKDAVNKELKKLYWNNILKIEKTKNIPKDIKPLDVKWIFTIKYNGIYKVWLVFRVFFLLQNKGIDYICTYSPLIEMDSFRLIIAIASIYKWDLRQLKLKQHTWILI